MSQLLDLMNDVILLFFQIINNLIESYVFVIMIVTFVVFVWLLIRYLAKKTASAGQ